MAFYFMQNSLLGAELERMMIIRQSKILLGMLMVLVHFVFFLLCAVVLVVFDQVENDTLKMQLFLGVNTIELLVLFYVAIRWHNHHYVVGEDKILTSRGVFLRKQQFFALKNIESISLQQGILGRLFGFGTLLLYAPTLNQRIVMFGINDPQRKEIIIEKLLPSTSGGGKKEVMVVQGKDG